MLYKLKGNSLDAVLISIIRILTLAGNFCSVAILSRALSLSEYGTFSEGNLIVSVASSITILGMTDAANYYYNRNDDNRELCICTIFEIQILIGLLCAVIIFFARNAITSYFSNPMLDEVYLLLIFRPMFTNLSESLLILQPSIGKTRAVATRNVTIMVCKLISIIVIISTTKDLKWLFATCLGLDLFTVVFYYNNFRKAAFAFRPQVLKPKIVKDIFGFAIPMGIYVMANSLMRETDRILIAYFEDTSMFAIYTNCSQPLPLSFVSSSFLVVLLPLITRAVQQRKNEKAQQLCRAYLKIGYITTITFASVAIVLAEELIELLYGRSYISGKAIFILYIISDVIKITNITLILTARGKTKQLMFCSLGALLANAGLNIIFYHLFGVIGAALATVLVTTVLGVLLLQASSGEIGTNLAGLLDSKQLIVFLTQVTILSFAAEFLKRRLLAMSWPFYVVIIVVAAVYCSTVFVIKRRKIFTYFNIINQIVL